MTDMLFQGFPDPHHTPPPSSRGTTGRTGDHPVSLYPLRGSGTCGGCRHHATTSRTASCLLDGLAWQVDCPPELPACTRWEARSADEG